LIESNGIGEDRLVIGPDAGTITSQVLSCAGSETTVYSMGEGPTVLLIHGSGPGVSALGNWESLMEALSPKFRLVALDLAGFGRSTLPRSAARSDRRMWTDQIVAVMDQLRLDRVALVGFSLGAALALSVAVERPEAVRALCLLGAMGGRMEISQGLSANWSFRSESTDAEMRTMMDFITYDKSLITEATVATRMSRVADGGRISDFAALFPEPHQALIDDLTLSDSELALIRQKVVLIHGRDDEVVHLMGSPWHLLEWIDNSELLIFPRCGHSPLAEKPRQTATAISDFLDDQLP
jgi:2-hydroxymuconate-semialdehyde hydrolase